MSIHHVDYRCLLHHPYIAIIIYFCFEIFFRGIGAVVYRVHELENDKLLKISLRSVDSEDTTLISQVFASSCHIWFSLLPAK